MAIFTTLFIALNIFILGWGVSLLINHMANAIPLRETIGQAPFCKRPLSEFDEAYISISHQDAPSQPKRPYCHAPKSRLQWSAVMAYLMRQQYCQVCGKTIGLRALIVELVTPILFVFLYQQYALSIYLGFLCLYTLILILLMITDLEHRLIQNIVILPAILSALVGAFFAPNFSWQQALVGGATGFMVFYLLALISRSSLGSGDVTLSAFLGLITAFPNVITVIFFGIFFAGGISAILWLTRLVTLKTYIPYGPFLIISGWFVMIWGEPLFEMFWG